MKFIRKFQLIGLLVFGFFVNSGCKKTDNPEPLQQIGGIKIFDDTTASAENSNIKISSGSNRLYMTYGRGSTWPTIINGMFLETTSPVSSVLMATDITGNLIWRNSLPTGISAATPVEMADGSCIVAGVDMLGLNLNIDDKQIYIFRFDNVGSQISVDSLVLPADFGNYRVWNLDVIKISGTDILIYGTAAESRGFAINYNVNSGTIWAKPIDFGASFDPSNTTHIYSCIKTIDGGFMFMGIYSSPTQPGSPDYAKTIVLKTDENCDTLWTNWFDFLLAGPPNEIVRPSNIIQFPNGDYYLCNNDIKSFENIYKFNSFIYKLNSDGDSIGGFYLTGPGVTYCSQIIEGTDQDIVGLYNEYPDWLYLEMTPIFTQFNTQLYSFDTNLNIKSSSSIQSFHTDFMVSACKTPDGRIAMFGLNRTKNHESFVPALIIK